MAADSTHYAILLRPVLTEKSTDEQHRLNDYRFEVAGGANKIQIRQAVQALFGVEVESVRTSIRTGKPRRRGIHAFHTSPRKIAIIRLKEGHKIDLL